ncbi:hypothetical protein [Variovorax sp. JS1663]|uniref:hypothetical protein n=1 Tax=Variovorax sp. JS1663 TaxID=1851577 RepID=UPI0013025BA7|nr:hypothetical protein [Variovorax sp. JS1663]
MAPIIAKMARPLARAEEWEGKGCEIIANRAMMRSMREGRAPGRRRNVLRTWGDIRAIPAARLALAQSMRLLPLLFAWCLVCLKPWVDSINIAKGNCLTCRKLVQPSRLLALIDIDNSIHKSCELRHGWRNLQ